MNEQKEQNVQEEKKGKGLFYLVIASAIVIVAIVGATYAYFTTNIATNEGEVEVGSSTTTITLDKQDDSYSPGNIIPATNVIAQYGFENQTTISYTCSKTESGTTTQVPVTESDYNAATDPETAVNVWKWSLGGLGFSETGVNGTYEVAITQDGGINANFITAGKINTNLIEGYEQIEFRIKDAEDDIDDLQDNTYTKEEIQDIADGTGVNGVVVSAIKLPNTQGYVDKTGMHFHKDGAPTKSTIDEKGIEVDNTSDNTPALYAGHVDSNDSRFNTNTRSFENKSIVYTHNLVNKGDAVLGNHALIMDYTDENGNAGTGWFVI